MKSKWITVSLALLLCSAMLAGCTPTNLATTDAPGAVVSPSQTPVTSPTIAPSTSVEPSETPIPTPMANGAVDETLADSFKSIAKASDLVIRGEYVEKVKDLWNQVRYLDDNTKPDPDYFIFEEQYKFKITEIYKNDAKKPFKVGDIVTINLPYSDLATAKNKDKAPMSPNYMATTLNEDTVIFVNKSDDIAGITIWYPDVQPYHFTVKNDKLIVKAAKEATVTSWNKKNKNTDGIPVANLKKDLGVK